MRVNVQEQKGKLIDWIQRADPPYMMVALASITSTFLGTIGMLTQSKITTGVCFTITTCLVIGLACKMFCSKCNKERAAYPLLRPDPTV